MSCPPGRLAPPIRLLLALGWAWLLAAVLLLHFGVPHFTDVDPWFHARYAEQLPERLFDRTFEATEWSLWTTRWADKEFLFHVWMMPFCQWGEEWLVPGARLSGALIVMALLGSLALLWREQRIAGAAWWPLLLLAGSATWWMRMGYVRGHLASVLLVPWILVAFERRRPRRLAVATFLYLWSYTAFFFPLVLVSLAAAGRWCHARLGGEATAPDAGAPGAGGAGASDARLWFVCAGASLVGFVIHPHLPNNLVILWTQVVSVLARAWSGSGGAGEIAMASELRSDLFRESLLIHPGIWGALLAGAAIALLAPERTSARTAALAMVVGPVLVLYALSARFIEYLAPLSVWFLASVADDRREALARAWRSLSAVPRRVALVGAAAAASLVHAWVLLLVTTNVLWPPFAQTQAAPAAWLREHTAPGDSILLLDWGSFPLYYFHLPDRRFPFGFDPTFIDVTYPEKLAALERAMHARTPIDPEELRAVSPRARWMVVWSRAPRVQDAVEEAGFVAAYADAEARIYDLREPSDAAREAPVPQRVPSSGS